MNDIDKEVFAKALSEFKRSVEITRDVRFQANLRLFHRQKTSNYFVAFLSLFVIALSLLPNFLVLQAYQNQILLACSIILSVFIIFTSLIDGAQNFYHQGELLHQCARKIATVHHKLKTISPSSDIDIAKQQLEALQEEYRAALDECPINHDNVDFRLQKARKPHLFEHERWKNVELWVIYHRCVGSVQVYSWLFLPIIVVFIVIFVVYSYVVSGSVFVGTS